jgi:predicted aspartyl protease
MPKTEIFFLDRNYQLTTDRVTGTPSVYATVAIDGMEVMSGRPAVVDTGADFCIVNAGELSLFGDQVRPADKSKIEHPYLRGEQTDVYEGTITIHGLDEPVQTYFIPKNLRPPILIGRHVLERYNMIYNPLGGEFSLEKS